MEEIPGESEMLSFEPTTTHVPLVIIPEPVVEPIPNTISQRPKKYIWIKVIVIIVLGECLISIAIPLLIYLLYRNA